jgi:endonuclease I
VSGVRADIVGVASVIAGDTIEIHGQRPVVVGTRSRLRSGARRSRSSSPPDEGVVSTIRCARRWGDDEAATDVWPESHGFPSAGQLAHTDIHYLRPTDVTCNSDCDNLDFDESDEAHPACAASRRRQLRAVRRGEGRYGGTARGFR